MSVALPADSLHEGLERLGLPTGMAPEDRLLAYLELLQRWNRAYNLTAITDPAEMVTRHLLDSLAVLPWIDCNRLLDAGSGAGLPGIPLALARPGIEVTLLDSAGKKTRFLRHACRELGLDNVHVVQDRLERYEPTQPFGRIISRALSGLAAFAEAARHLIAPSGRLLAMKGRYPHEELSGLPQWVRVQTVEELSVPGLQQDRHLVIMSVND